MKLNVKDFVGFYSWLIDDEREKSIGTDWYLDDLYVRTDENVLLSSYTDGCYDSDSDMLDYLRKEDPDKIVDFGFYIHDSNTSKHIANPENVHKEYLARKKDPLYPREFLVSMPYSMVEEFKAWVTSKDITFKERY